MAEFDRYLDLVECGPGNYDGSVDGSWSVMRGANGGFLAALVLRAMGLAVDNPSRSPRSLTVHYSAPAEPGPVTVETAIEREGRSLTLAAARLVQADKLLVAGRAVFSEPRDGMEFSQAGPPPVASPESLGTGGFPMPVTPPFFDHWDYRPAFGAGEVATDEALMGGWIRLADTRVPDPAVVAAMADAYPPAPLARRRQHVFAATIDLTVHFRSLSRLAECTTDEFLLAVFRSRVAGEGYFEEDGEIWSHDGVLIAQSRQLALAASPKLNFAPKWSENALASMK